MGKITQFKNSTLMIEIRIHQNWVYQYNGRNLPPPNNKKNGVKSETFETRENLEKFANCLNSDLSIAVGGGCKKLWVGVKKNPRWHLPSLISEYAPVTVYGFRLPNTIWLSLNISKGMIWTHSIHSSYSTNG